MSDKPNAAFGNLAAGVLGLVAIGSTPKMPWYLGVPTFTAGLCALAGTVARHRRNGLTLNDYSDGLEQFSEEAWDALEGPLDWLAGKAEPVIKETIVPKVPGLAELLKQMAEAEQNFDWLTSELIRAQKMVLGAQGTGKSTWLRYEARRFKAENPDGIIRIIDFHRNEEDGPWLPGIPEEDYLATDVKSALAVIREAKRVGQERIDSKTQNHPPYKLVIDEFQGVADRFDDAGKEELASVVAFILNELRKYQVSITLSSKSLKKEMTGLDSSLIGQMHLLALRNSLSDTTVRLPSDMDAKALLKKRSSVASLPGCQHACVYRALGKDAEICVIPPDLVDRAASYTFRREDDIPEPERWAMENKPFAFQAFSEGKTRTHIAEHVLDKFGKRNKTNYRWLLLTEWEQEFKASLPPVDDDEQLTDDELIERAMATACAR